MSLCLLPSSPPWWSWTLTLWNCETQQTLSSLRYVGHGVLSQQWKMKTPRFHVPVWKQFHGVFIVTKKEVIIKYSVYLIIIGIVLFIVGNLLSGTLEKLCVTFNIPEFIVGIALGFITSIPELITFFESQKHHKSKQDDRLGVIEATNNLLTSNMLNLFIIQSIGIILYQIFNWFIVCLWLFNTSQCSFK